MFAMQGDCSQNADYVHVEVHGPVINYSVVNCKKEKRHDSVTDGQLCGCPSQDVITQLHDSGAQEVMTN